MKLKLLNLLPTEIRLADIAVFVVALLLVIVPLLVNYDNLPIGWEVPKVRYLQLILPMLTVVFIVFAFKQKKLKLKSAAFFVVFLALMSIGSLVSTIPSEEGVGFNPIYQLLAIGEGGMAITGNQFREFGLVSVIIVAIFIYIFSFSIDKKNWQLLGIGFIVSALVQFFIAFSQFVNLAVDDFDKVVQGLYVNGSFGQSNFFAGHLLIGLVFCFYFLRSKKFSVQLFSVFSLVMFVIGIGISFSTWAQIVFMALVGLVLIWEFSHPTKKTKNLKIALILSSVGLVVIGLVLIKVFPSFTHRFNIWQGVLDVYLLNFFRDPSLESMVRMLFGSGFDTLGVVLKEFEPLKESLIDRAHNFVLDILANTGIIGIGLLLYLFKIINTKISGQLENRDVFYILLGIVVWSLRSLVHTSSIVNIFSIAVIIAILIRSQSQNNPASAR